MTKGDQILDVTKLMTVHQCFSHKVIESGINRLDAI